MDTARTFLPEAVFLDIGLPGMSGDQVARQLRCHPDLENVLLVAVTGYGRDEDRRLTRDAGFDEHLTKPVDLETMLDLIARREVCP